MKLFDLGFALITGILIWCFFCETSVECNKKDWKYNSITTEVGYKEYLKELKDEIKL